MDTGRRVRRLLSLACLVAAVAALATGAQAVDLKLVDMFPSDQGVGGWWLHSYEPATGAKVELTWASAFCFRMPESQSAGRIPLLEKLDGSIIMHPGLNSSAQDRWAVLSYVAPAAGDYTFNVAFSNAAASPGCTTNAYVLVDPVGSAWLSGTRLFEGSVSATSSAITGFRTVSLAAGDRLRFAVSGMGNVSFDSTRLADVPLGTLPEPGSLVALASGLMGLLAIRRRK